MLASCGLPPGLHCSLPQPRNLGRLLHLCFGSPEAAGLRIRSIPHRIYASLGWICIDAAFFRLVVVPVFIACDAHVHALRVVCFLFPGDDLRPGPVVGLPVAALLRGGGRSTSTPTSEGGRSPSGHSPPMSSLLAPPPHPIRALSHPLPPHQPLLHRCSYS
ncbi:hypothetical protein PVAP13_9KG253226 [Panicum virgatum]|uniref:Uncharacterized protein n=1 Tax=Panicum virgatum TaxID=38727 RepID=A0A8T0NHM6_PANVG|nr:hypothetical protein PVAP13_9KG253226 [Panicum virgatum]